MPGAFGPLTETIMKTEHLREILHGERHADLSEVVRAWLRERESFEVVECGGCAPPVLAAPRCDAPGCNCAAWLPEGCAWDGEQPGAPAAGPLSSRLRPDVECAPWVIDEVRKLEARVAERAGAAQAWQVRCFYRRTGATKWQECSKAEFEEVASTGLYYGDKAQARALYTFYPESAAVPRPAVPERIVARAVFDELVSVMGSDNGVCFRAEPGDYERALDGVAAMISAGYFQCEVDDLDSDYWQMAAGEESEIAERFCRAPEAFATVNTVLNDIFDRPLPEVQRAAVPAIAGKDGA